MVNPNRPPWDERNYMFLRRLKLSVVIALSAAVLLVGVVILGLTGVWTTHSGPQTATPPPPPGEERPLADSYWYAVFMLAIAIVGPLINIIQALFRRDK